MNRVILNLLLGDGTLSMINQMQILMHERKLPITQIY